MGNTSTPGQKRSDTAVALSWAAGHAALAGAAVIAAANSLRPDAGVWERALAAVAGFAVVRLYLSRRTTLAEGARVFARGVRRAVGPLAAGIALGATVAAVAFPVSNDPAGAASMAAGERHPTALRLSRYGDAILMASRANEDRLPPMHDRVTLRYWVQDRPGFRPFDSHSRENGVPFFVNRRLSEVSVRTAEKSGKPLAWSEPIGGAGGRWVFFASGEVREVGRREWNRVRPRE